MVFLSDATGVFCIRVPKAGSTSMHHALREWQGSLDPGHHRAVDQVPRGRTLHWVAVVRHPVSRMLSWRRRAPDRRPVGRWLRDVLLGDTSGMPDPADRRIAQLARVTLRDWVEGPDGRCLVDRVIRHEHLARGWAQLQEDALPPASRCPT